MNISDSHVYDKTNLSPNEQEGSEFFPLLLNDFVWKNNTYGDSLSNHLSETS